MKLRRTYWVLVLFSLCCVLSSCEDVATSTNDEEKISGLPDLELFTAKIEFSSGNQTSMILESPHISRYETNQMMVMDGGMIVDFFDKDGQHSGVLTSDEGEVLEREQRLTARGHVIVKSDSGMVLYADTLYYDPDIDRVKSDGFVTMVTPQDSLSGWGLTATSNMQQWEIRDTGGETWRNIDKAFKGRDSKKEAPR